MLSEKNEELVRLIKDDIKIGQLCKKNDELVGQLSKKNEELVRLLEDNKLLSGLVKDTKDIHQSTEILQSLM